MDIPVPDDGAFSGCPGALTSRPFLFHHTLSRGQDVRQTPDINHAQADLADDNYKEEEMRSRGHSPFIEQTRSSLDKDSAVKMSLRAFMR